MTKRPWNKRLSDEEREAERLDYERRVAEAQARFDEDKQKALADVRPSIWATFKWVGSAWTMCSQTGPPLWLCLTIRWPTSAQSLDNETVITAPGAGF
jgi:hypothetical protein